MVMAQSLFQALKEMQPDSIVDVLAPEWTLPIVERMPEVRRRIVLPSRHGHLGLMMRFGVGRKLRKEAYDEAVVIPRSLKSALPSYFAGIQSRVGFSHHLGLINRVRTAKRSRQELFIRRYLALVRDDADQLGFGQIPKPQLNVDKHNQSVLLEQNSLESGQFVVLCPGAEYGPAKRWPSRYFASLADQVFAAGLKIVIMGSSKDIGEAGNIIALAPKAGILSLCGQTSLADVVDLSAASHSVVSNDSGLMHVACAAGARVIAIFGSSSPAYTPPLSEMATVLQKAIDCQPCFDRNCRYGHYECLEGIKPDQVLQALNL